MTMELDTWLTATAMVICATVGVVLLWTARPHRSLGARDGGRTAARRRRIR